MSWLDTERERWLRKAVGYERQLEKATRPLKSSADFSSYKQKEEVRRGAAKGGVTKAFKATGAAEARPLQQGKHRVKAQSNSVKMSGVERTEQNQQAASFGQTNKRVLWRGMTSEKADRNSGEATKVFISRSHARSKKAPSEVQERTMRGTRKSHARNKKEPREEQERATREAKKEPSEKPRKNQAKS